MLSMILPSWPAPAWVKACTTTRLGGVSQAPFNEFNLATHNGDNQAAVKINRTLLQNRLQLPSEPAWLNQVHGAHVIQIEKSEHDSMLFQPTADGSWTGNINTVCAVNTADCLPVLFCDLANQQVAAVHAGWRGLAAGILEVAISKLNTVPNKTLVWLGPAIGPQFFEVGEEVRAKFIATFPEAKLAFQPSPQGRWLANLYLLAKQRLARVGITHVYGGDFCTYSDPERFYSYRRDKMTGRMASLIWMIK